MGADCRSLSEVPASGVATSGTTTAYTYDDAGQLLSATPSSGTASSWTYDDLGRRATQTVGAVTTTYGYDDAGRLTSATPSSGTASTFAYDDSGRRLSDTTGASVTTYGYDVAGRLSGITLPGGDTQLRSLDPQGLPEAVANTVSGTTSTWAIDWDPTIGTDRPVAFTQGSATTDLVGLPGIAWGIASKGSAHSRPLSQRACASMRCRIVSQSGCDAYVVPRSGPYGRMLRGSSLKPDAASEECGLVRLRGHEVSGEERRC
jgi:YD repeat-containing protein